jgi:hypothetical protein
MMVANGGRNPGAGLYAFHSAFGSLERRTTFDESLAYCQYTNVSKLIVAISFVTETVRFAANWSAATSQ